MARPMPIASMKRSLPRDTMDDGCESPTHRASGAVQAWSVVHYQPPRIGSGSAAAPDEVTFIHKLRVVRTCAGRQPGNPASCTYGRATLVGLATASLLPVAVAAAVTVAVAISSSGVGLRALAAPLPRPPRRAARAPLGHLPLPRARLLGVALLVGRREVLELLGSWACACAWSWRMAHGMGMAHMHGSCGMGYVEGGHGLGPGPSGRVDGGWGVA